MESAFQWFDFVRVDNTRHSRRSSSTSPLGDNRDRLSIVRGETHTLLDVAGPGCVTHLWLTCHSIENFYLRKAVLKMYWDGEAEPSVLVPLGDFFGVGHGQTATYSSLPMVMAPSDGTGLNCYLPMPFSRGARIEVTSENFASETRLYYNIDYERWDAPRDELGRFHACWRRQNPCDGIAEPPEMDDHTFRSAGTNLDDEGNYLILEARRQRAVRGLQPEYPQPALPQRRRQLVRRGRRDDLRRRRQRARAPPADSARHRNRGLLQLRLGAGSEFASPFFGLNLPGGRLFTGCISWYRWHIPDPVRFTRSIRGLDRARPRQSPLATIIPARPTGTRLEPHTPFGILPVAQRLPRADFPELKPPA